MACHRYTSKIAVTFTANEHTSVRTVIGGRGSECLNDWKFQECLIRTTKLSDSTVIYDINHKWHRLHLLKISDHLRCTQKFSMPSNSVMNDNLNWGTHRPVTSRGCVI